MALQTPLHLKRRHLISERHLVNAAVTGRASHALVHMNAVVEVDELRQIMNARPPERLARTKARAHGFEHGAVRPDLRMTVHAGGRGRQSCEGVGFYGRVTIAAINAVVRDVMLMAEGHGLLARNARFRDVRRAANGDYCPRQPR